ncbi:MAG: thioredoxin [Eubacteriales bacterium]
MAVLHLNNDNFEATIANGVTLVDFYAQWCGPCKMLTPVIEKLADRFDGTAQVAKVDVDVAGALAAQFGIMSVPTILIFKDGKLISQSSGAQPESKLASQIDAVLA